MVVKTELCAFSEYRIYPGKGMLYIRRDGRPVTLGSSKARCMMNQRLKPMKLMWTQVWRRMNKKGLSESNLKKRARKVTKVQRAVVGASLEDIKKKATQSTLIRTAQNAEAIKAAKDRKTKASEAKKAAAKANKSVNNQKVAKNAIKNQGKKGSTQR
jgi:large subunit ribosomal protein L24e